MPPLPPCSHSWAAHCSLQVFSAVGLRHPAAGAGLQSGTFVPNTVHLGGDSAPFIVLTGPNMGGKSTLMRQVGSERSLMDRYFRCCYGLCCKEGACVCSESGCCMTPLSAAGNAPATHLSALSCGYGGHKVRVMLRPGVAYHRLDLLLAACQATAQILGHDRQTGSPRRQSDVAGVPGSCDGPGGGLGAG